VTDALVVVLIWAVAAYVLLPVLWRHHEHAPALAAAPFVTRTPEGIPGDPVNLAVVGTADELHASFAAAGWAEAAPITLRSSVGIVTSVLLHRADPCAPVSTLELFGRPHDVAFERVVDGSARRRHHVRFWATELVVAGDRPTWLGAATFDCGVELSRRTGQVTHRIAPAVDDERDGIVEALTGVGRIERVFAVTGVGATLRGRNGGGDRYVTDGEIAVMVLLAEAAPASGEPERLASPAVVRVKDRMWRWLRRLVQRGYPASAALVS
jgi:hypothetical protein